MVIFFACSLLSLKYACNSEIITPIKVTNTIITSKKITPAPLFLFICFEVGTLKYDLPAKQKI